MKSKIILITALAFLLLSEGIFAQTFKIIVNSSNSVTSLTKKEASDFFLKKKTKWSDGASVMPVDLTSGSKVRDDFSQQIHGKGTSAIRSFWQQAAFSGTASAPPEKSNDTEIIDFVKKNPGAIGYVSSNSNTDGVKTISIQ
jgi:ABC-type phosphate transport system substrate-binding protein